MTGKRLSDLLVRFEGNAPAMPGEIDAVEREMLTRLPRDYRTFLTSRSDGGNGFVGSTGYVMLWRVSELAPFNRDYEVAEYAPGLMLFGSNGGGEAFAFDLRGSDRPVVSVPFIGLDLSAVRPVAESFEGFLEYLAHL